MKPTISRVVLAACAVAGVMLGLSSSGNAMQSRAPQIRQPSHWVPMTIDYKVENAKGTTHLREYRRSDGSVRHEMPLEPETGITTIADLAGQRFFEFERGVWRQFPLRPLPFDGKPFMTLARDSVTPVDGADPRVQAAARLSSELTYYEFVGPSGNRAIFCPELNMLELWSHFVSGSVRETIQVALGEPSASFEPPPGATVQLFSEARGGGPITQSPSAKQAKP